MGRTTNIIIKDVFHIFASISKIMRILLMGRRNRERWEEIAMEFICSMYCVQTSEITLSNHIFLGSVS